MRIPSSMTKLVEANMKATAATKWAPFSTRARAAARAAKEQEEETAPKIVERETLLRLGLPMYCDSRSLGTKAWIMALTK